MDHYATPEIARVMEYAHEVLPELEAAAPGLSTVAGLLAVGLGALREVYLCPVCGPGVYRRELPPERGVDRLGCAQCGGVWHRVADVAAAPKRKARTSRHRPSEA